MADADIPDYVYPRHLFSIGEKVYLAETRAYMGEKYINLWLYEK
jgi:hypothetical protein